MFKEKNGTGGIEMRRTTIALVSIAIIVALAGLFAGSWVTVQAEPNAIDLDRISEQTGYVAATEPLSEDCFFDDSYQVYLCIVPHEVVEVASDPAARAEALARAQSHGILLVPNIATMNIVALDPTTGNVIDPSFIELDSAATGLPVHAIWAPGDRILVSDQTISVVHQYDMDGNYLGVFAPAGGQDFDIMQNIRGMALRPNGNLLVTVAGGANADTVVEFDTNGALVGTFVTASAGGLTSPYDVYRRGDVDWLVSSSNTDQILRYGLDTGDFLAVLAAVNDFPQQIAQAANDNVLVANFSGTQMGIVELTSTGTLVGVYAPDTVVEYRGVYELPNNNLLVSTTGGIFEIGRDGSLVSTKFVGNTRFIEPVVFPVHAHTIYLSLIFR
jgi:hypothetical protein